MTLEAAYALYKEDPERLARHKAYNDKEVLCKFSVLDEIIAQIEHKKLEIHAQVYQKYIQESRRLIEEAQRIVKESEGA